MIFSDVAVWWTVFRFGIDFPRTPLVSSVPWWVSLISPRRDLALALHAFASGLQAGARAEYLSLFPSVPALNAARIVPLRRSRDETRGGP